MTAALRPSAPLDHAPPRRRKIQGERRLPVRLAGRFQDEAAAEHALTVVASSCLSAEVRSKVCPIVGERIVCYIDQLGRIEGTVSDTAPGGFVLRFEQSDRRRDKLADLLVWLVNKDGLDLSDERQSERYSAGGLAQVQLGSGGVISCRVVDISLTGAGFETTRLAPPVGELVTVGSLRGQVVRAQGRSFGIRFLF